MKTLMFSSISLSAMFMFSSHPISMMILIIAQTFLLCLTIWLKLSMSWFSYIMFLIYLGGLMVLFIYISSLAYNEKFKVFFKEMITLMMVLLSIMIYMFSCAEKKMMNQPKMENNELIFKVYSVSSTMVTSLTIIYLIITLIVVVKMTSQFNGPLRSKN